MKRILLSLLLTAAVVGCTQVRNPATGALQYTTLSQSDERQLGAQEHPKVLAEFGGDYEDAKASAYVERIGKKLSAVSELPDQTFNFSLLNSPVVNAFALPGGYVYVTRGLLALAADEAEVAGVLAHEIGHVTARHTAQRDTQSTMAQGASVVGIVLGGLFMGEAGAKAAAQLAQSAAPAWVMSYSRDQEFEADELGIRYLGRAGYDPRAMASFLGRLQAQDELQSAQLGRQPSVEESLYASHPRTLDRVARAANEAAGQTAGGKRDRGAYLTAVDGMLYGDDPSQGLVIGRTFVHPALGIRFDAPPGFVLANTPQAVIGRAADGSAMVFDQDALQTQDIQTYLQRQWPGPNAIRAIWPGMIDGRPGATGLAIGKVGSQTRQVVVGAVDGGEGKVWRFQFVAPQMDQRSAAAYQQSIESMQFLTPAEAARFRGEAIEVYTVKPGDRLARLMDTDDPQLLATVRLLNGLPAGGEPNLGDTIKLIVSMPGSQAPAAS